MILAIDRATYIKVLKANMKPKLSVKLIAEIRSDNHADIWVMEFIGRDWNYYSDLLDYSEKRQIIGMLDKLNRTDKLSKENLLDVWENEVIRRSDAALGL